MDIRSAVLGARDGYLAPVQAFLDGGGDPDYTDRSGVRLIHIASDYRHPAIVKLLLERGANPNVIDRDGWTPLFNALSELRLRTDEQRARGVEIVKLLLAAKADPLAGVTLPLAEAAKRGSIDAVRLLLDAGADVNQGDPHYGSTALIAAINGAHPGIVELLLAVGADVNQADVRGQTPLIRAILGPGMVQGSPERRALCLALAKSFVDKGANVNCVMDGGESALMCAVNENWHEMIRFLLDAGAHAEHIDARGRGLVRWAVDGALRLSLEDQPALALVRSVADAGARDFTDAVDWARKRGRATLAESIERLRYK